MIKDRIKTVRLSLGLSMGSFGRLCGLTRIAIHNYESGKRKPDYDSMKKIIDATELDPAVFFTKKVSITTVNSSAEKDQIKDKFNPTKGEK